MNATLTERLEPLSESLLQIRRLILLLRLLGGHQVRHGVPPADAALLDGLLLLLVLLAAEVALELGRDVQGLLVQIAVIR